MDAEVRELEAATEAIARRWLSTKAVLNGYDMFSLVAWDGKPSGFSVDDPYVMLAAMAVPSESSSLSFAGPAWVCTHPLAAGEFETHIPTLCPSRGEGVTAWTVDRAGRAVGLALSYDGVRLLPGAGAPMAEFYGRMLGAMRAALAGAGRPVAAGANRAQRRAAARHRR